MAIENPSRKEIGKILKENKRIAVVGLSNNPNRTSYMISQAMMDAGYDIIPVNPTIDESLGIKAVDSLKDIEGHVDIVNVFRRSEYLPDIMKDAVAINADVFWSQLGVSNEEAYEYGKKHNIKMVMDRCIKVEHAMTK